MVGLCGVCVCVCRGEVGDKRGTDMPKFSSLSSELWQKRSGKHLYNFQCPTILGVRLAVLENLDSIDQSGFANKSIHTHTQGPLFYINMILSCSCLQ